MATNTRYTWEENRAFLTAVYEVANQHYLTERSSYSAVVRNMRHPSYFWTDVFGDFIIHMSQVQTPHISRTEKSLKKKWDRVSKTLVQNGNELLIMHQIPMELVGGMLSILELARVWEENNIMEE